MPYLLALIAAGFAATGAALQHREVNDVTEEDARGLRLLWSAIKRPGWLIGMLVLLGAPVFQFLALKMGNLSQVQPVLTTELLFLLGIIIVTHHERPGRQEWLGALCIVVGLGTFLIAAHPHGGSHHLGRHWAGILTILLVVIVAGFFGFSRFVTGWPCAALLGAAAATCFAYQAAMTSIIAGVPFGSIITSPGLLGLAVSGALGFAIFQYALRAGHVAASRASMVIVDPLLSVAIGVLAFGDVLRRGTGAVVIELLGLIILVVGAQRLATSPLIAGIDAVEVTD